MGDFSALFHNYLPGWFLEVKMTYMKSDSINSYQEALEQILNSNNKIYQGRSDLFYQLVDFYCDQERLVKRH